MHCFRTAKDTQSSLAHYEFNWAHKILIESFYKLWVQFCIVVVVVNMPYYPNFYTLYYMTLSLFSNQEVGWTYVIEGESN